jgi:hypothetical protein
MKVVDTQEILYSWIYLCNILVYLGIYKLLWKHNVLISSTLQTLYSQQCNFSDDIY